MNSISSCRGGAAGVPESGCCDDSKVSRCKYPAYVSRSLKSMTMPGSSGVLDMVENGLRWRSIGTRLRRVHREDVDAARERRVRPGAAPLLCYHSANDEMVRLD